MILPASDERGLVVFHVFPELDYSKRLIGAVIAIALGFLIQAATATLLPGVLLIAGGNLLLLVRGYDNRVDAGSFDAGAGWERIERERLDELVALHQKMRRWDSSALDITNVLGLVLLVPVSVALGLLVVFAPGLPRVLAVDAIVLLLPHWFTGVRKILVRPKLLVRVEVFRDLLDTFADRLSEHRVQPLALLGDKKIPEDIKLKVDIAGHHPDFLGLYGQVVLNEVNGSSYPYFYVVLVAKRGFGLVQAATKQREPEDCTLETKEQDEVEVLVLRQTTTKTSGYHTDTEVTRAIFGHGLGMAETLAVKP